jgi:hypothetical protein
MHPQDRRHRRHFQHKAQVRHLRRRLMPAWPVWDPFPGYEQQGLFRQLKMLCTSSLAFRSCTRHARRTKKHCRVRDSLPYRISWVMLK